MTLTRYKVSIISEDILSFLAADKQGTACKFVSIPGESLLFFSSRRSGKGEWANEKDRMNNMEKLKSI